MWSCVRNSAAPKKRSSSWLTTQMAVLNCYAKMTARVIEKLSRCKIIARYGIGVDNVDLVAAKQGENSGDQRPRLLC